MRRFRSLLLAVVAAVIGCVNAMADSTLPGDLLEIGQEAFAGNLNIHGNVVLPEGMISIGSKAFQGCTQMDEISLPASLEQIAQDAFADCPDLVFRVKEGSYAHDWCLSNAVQFVIVSNLITFPQSAVLKKAAALGVGESLAEPTALDGEIIRIDTPWSADYQNITVTIKCEGAPALPIKCYRVSGPGAEHLAVGDRIAVWGTLQNHEGTIRFRNGCKLISHGSAEQVRILLKAYTLEHGECLEKPATLTGVIVKIPTAWSPHYKNITVDIVVAGMDDHVIQCYRLVGEGAESLAIGDTITVTGIIKNYKGTIEFDKGCTLVEKH